MKLRQALHKQLQGAAGDVAQCCADVKGSKAGAGAQIVKENRQVLLTALPVVEPAEGDAFARRCDAQAGCCPGRKLSCSTTASTTAAQRK